MTSDPHSAATPTSSIKIGYRIGVAIGRTADLIGAGSTARRLARRILDRLGAGS